MCSPYPFTLKTSAEPSPMRMISPRLLNARTRKFGPSGKDRTNRGASGASVRPRMRLVACAFVARWRGRAGKR